MINTWENIKRTIHETYNTKQDIKEHITRSICYKLKNENGESCDRYEYQFTGMSRISNDNSASVILILQLVINNRNNTIDEHANT